MAFLMDPNAVLDYEFDWTPWLAAGETITGHTVSASGLTVGQTVSTGTTVTVWLSGGTDGATATVTCHVTTSAGRQDGRTITIRVMER